MNPVRRGRKHSTNSPSSAAWKLHPVGAGQPHLRCRTFRESLEPLTRWAGVLPVAQSDTPANPSVPFPDFFIRQADFEVVEPPGAVAFEFEEPSAHRYPTTAGGDGLNASFEPLGGFLRSADLLSPDIEPEEVALTERSDFAFVLIDQ